MDDLIKRKDAERALTLLGAQLSYKHTRTVEKCVCAIKDVPSVDAEPVRHGQWETTLGSYCTPHCTNCGWHIPYSEDSVLDARNYCPNCGAKMDGGLDDD